MSCCVPTVVLFFPSLGVRAPETICSERKDGSKDNSTHNNKKARIIDDQKKKIDDRNCLKCKLSGCFFFFLLKKNKNEIFSFPRYSIYVFRLHGGVRANTQMQSQ